MKNSVLIILFLLSISNGFSQYLVNFEGATETKGAYASGTVSLSGLNWDMTEALIGTTSGSDYFVGTRSARFRGYSTSSMTMLSNISGAGTVSFTYRIYSTDTQNPYSVEYSTDNGANWTSIGAFTATSTVQTFSQVVNICTAIRFRIICTGTVDSNRRMNLDDFNVTSCSYSNTITTGSVSSPPFSVTCTTGASGTVAFTSAGTYGAGNVYTAQLSDASGSFSSPTTIGVLSSISNSGSIPITIPAGTPTGSGYLIRIVSDNPAIIGSSSSSFSISLSGGPCILLDPHVSSLIYDGCNTSSPCNEGESEVVFANTGGYSVLASTGNISLNYTTGASYNLLGTIVDVPATTSAINTASGCSGTYLNGYGVVIPPNSAVLLAPSNICTIAFDWPALCGSGPVYIIYGQSGTSGDTWRTGGNFGNEDNVKTFDFSVTATNSTTYSSSYDYDPPSSGTDGNYVTYGTSPVGGSPTTQGNFPACSFTPVVLGTEIISFTGNYISHNVVLDWVTSSERNISHYAVFRSANGFDWQEIGVVNSLGNTSHQQDYQLVDVNPAKGKNYYRLQTVDFDAKKAEKGIIMVEVDHSTIFYNQLTSMIELGEASDVEIYSTDGKLIHSSVGKSKIPFNKSGMYIVHFVKTGKTERIMVW